MGGAISAKNSLGHSLFHRVIRPSATACPIVNFIVSLCAYCHFLKTTVVVRILFYLNTDSGDCEHQFFSALGSAPV